MKTELIERKIFTIGYSIQVKLQVAKCESEEDYTGKRYDDFSIEEVEYTFFDEYYPKEQFDVKKEFSKMLELEYNTTLEKHIMDYIYSDDNMSVEIIEELYNI